MHDDPNLLHLISHHLPGYDVRSMVPMGEGLDHVAWLVNDELVVRQKKSPDAESIRREVALLETVGRHATLPVPHVAFAEPNAGVIAYRYIPGRPLLNMEEADAAGIAEQLGGFLSAIHRIPLAEVDGIAQRDDFPLHA